MQLRSSEDCRGVALGQRDDVLLNEDRGGRHGNVVNDHSGVLAVPESQVLVLGKGALDQTVEAGAVGERRTSEIPCSNGSKRLTYPQR